MGSIISARAPLKSRCDPGRLKKRRTRRFLGKPDVAVGALIFPPAFMFIPIWRRGWGGGAFLCRGRHFEQPEQIFSEDQLIFDPHISHQSSRGLISAFPGIILQVDVTSRGPGSQFRCIRFSFFLFFLNCKVYSPTVTTPLQKTANWEGSSYILCRRGRGRGRWGWGGGGMKDKEKKARDFNIPSIPGSTVT